LPYLTVKQIAIETKLPIPTIKGILTKLVEKRWVENRKMIAATISQKRKHSMELVRIIVKQKKKKTIIWLPMFLYEDFKKKLFNLKRQKKEKGSKFYEKSVENYETYAQVLNMYDKRKSARIKSEHNLQFKGRTKLVKTIKNWPKIRKKNFYKILVYPYVIDDRMGGHTKLTTKELLTNRWKDIPEKHRPFWKNAAKEIKEINNLKN